MRLLVTGGGGFVGSHFVRATLERTDHHVKCLLRNTYTKRLHMRLLDHVRKHIDSGRLEICYGDLLGDLSGICEKVDCVLHAAAKTYVDHAILDPKSFIDNNVIGTFNLLEDARKHKVRKFIFVSTDECLGEILSGSYKEDAPPNPRNPYAATKLAGEGLAISYAHTYGMNTVVTRMENIYGDYQHPQKVFPTFVRQVMNGKKLTIYGSGLHVRQWLHCQDAVEAFLLLIEKEVSKGEVYHIAGNQELTNLELAKRILCAMGASEDMIGFVDDSDIRPGHDRRYALCSDKIKSLGWMAKIPLDVGIPQTAQWYRDNPSWC